ncbi:ferritin-like domain-containing protein [Rubrobacter aplysinae]|uniref:ferritin-like domain-containing protein n=1 Tax=Rubrobacter aplysinae TaxID=909625 RepID=UPI00069FFB1A|nr:ferritin-like domain-containing protein [Rubrobacter aplysinae]
MDKPVINVPEASALAQPRTRKDFFKSLAVAGFGAAAGAAALTPRAFAQYGTSGGDIGIANFALTLEFLEAEFYTLAVNSGMLAGEALAVVTNLRDHELAHADAVSSLIQDAGGTPVAKPEFTFPDSALASQAAILETAATLEPVGVGAYLGAGPMIQSPEVLAAAGSIEVIEGEHVVAVNDLIGVVPPANTAFPEALTKDQVLAAIAPFMGMAEMPDTGGVAQ